ncbi:MAG: hypothetical protein ACI9U2_000433 [Bradymonadia bacterium]
MLLLSLLWGSAAVADPSVEPAELRGLSASPEAPRFALEHDLDTWTTARFAAIAPIFDPPRGAGWFAQLVPQLETDGPIIPYLRWRGRLGVELGYDLPLSTGLLIVSGGLEHESDHRTVGPNTHVQPLKAPVAVVLNNVLARVDWVRPLRRGSLVSTAIFRGHVLTCTTTAEDCPDGTAGSRGIEATGELLWVDRTRILSNFGLFGGLAATWMGKRAKIGGERRLDLRMGLRQFGRENGQWQVAIWHRRGSPVGVERGIVTDETRSGLSLAFSR